MSICTKCLVHHYLFLIQISLQGSLPSLPQKTRPRKPVIHFHDTLLFYSIGTQDSCTAVWLMPVPPTTYRHTYTLHIHLIVDSELLESRDYVCFVYICTPASSTVPNICIYSINIFWKKEWINNPMRQLLQLCPFYRLQSCANLSNSHPIRIPWGSSEISG